MLPEFLSNEWIIIYGGLALTLLIVFSETAFPIGTIITGGEILLIVAGLLGGTRWIEVNLLFIVIPVTIIAFMADLTAYSIGYKRGQAVYERTNKLFYKKKYLTRTARFIDKYGIWSMVLAKFVPIIRTFNPLINGAREKSFNRFFIYTGIGNLVYVNSLILLGFFIGKKFPYLKEDVEYIVGAVVLFIFVTPIITLIRRSAKIDKKREA